MPIAHRFRALLVDIAHIIVKRIQLNQTLLQWECKCHVCFRIMSGFSFVEWLYSCIVCHWTVYVLFGRFCVDLRDNYACVLVSVDSMMIWMVVLCCLSFYLVFLIDLILFDDCRLLCISFLYFQ